MSVCVLLSYYSANSIMSTNNDAALPLVDISNESEIKKCNQNLHSKGKSGQHKRYFKQRYRKRKGKPALNLEIGESIVFESKGGEVGQSCMYVGRIRERNSHTQSYTVGSDAQEGRQYEIYQQDNPRSLSDLLIGADNLKIGVTVLVAWTVVDGFTALLPAQVVEVVDDDYVWIKTVKGDCVKVHIDNVIKTTKDSQVITRDVGELHVSFEEVSIIRLMLHATQTQLDEVNNTYRDTLSKLESKVKDTDDLKEKKAKLQELYDQSLTTTEEYRKQLIETTITTQSLHSLQQIITKQAGDLDEMSTRVIALEEELQKVRTEYHEQSKEMEDLKKQNSELRAKQNDMYKMKPSSPGSTGSTVQAKKIGNKTRPATFLPIAVPCHDKPSAKASRQTLRRRGEVINEVRISL